MRFFSILKLFYHETYIFLFFLDKKNGTMKEEGRDDK